MTKENLWGGIEGVETVRTPSLILREQADFLSELTKETLFGETVKTSERGRFYSTLYIVAPALDRYRYETVSIRHGVELYPVTLIDSTNRTSHEAEDESQFLNLLKEILSSPELRKVIMTLISESGPESDLSLL